MKCTIRLEWNQGHGQDAEQKDFFYAEKPDYDRKEELNYLSIINF